MFTTGEKKIAVVGAGLAGLTAAYKMAKQGVKSIVYEAKNRVGGRVLSVWLEKADGSRSIFELGGQNITDGGEAFHLLALCKELGLKILYKDLVLDRDVYDNNRFYSFSELIGDKVQLLQKIQQHQEQSDSIGVLIDQVCVDQRVLGKALKIGMEAYEGISVYQQSIYHNIYTLMSIVEGGLSKIHESLTQEENRICVGWIEGGNGLLPLRLQEELNDQIVFNKILKRVEKNDQRLTLHFSDHTFDQVDMLVLAVPAKILSDIDLTKSGIDLERIEKMSLLRMGKNFKVGYPISLEGWNGLSAVILEESIGFFTFDQTLFCLYGIKQNANLALEFERALQGFSLKKIEHSGIICDVDTPFSVHLQAVTHNWANDPFAGGSYAGYSTELSSSLDENTEISGVTYKALFAPFSEQIYFAGEHTTILECIGTMEAAVESGWRIAQAVIKKCSMD